MTTPAKPGAPAMPVTPLPEVEPERCANCGEGEEMTLYEQTIVKVGLQRRPIWPGDLGGYESVILDGAPRNARREFVRRFGFAIPSDLALEAIAEHAPILEIGSGAGYWAYELALRGVDIVATDPDPVPQGGQQERYGFHEAWHPIQRMESLKAIEAYPGRSLLIVWPCYDHPWAAQALDAYRGDTVLYVGEGHGGCTGDDRFHDLLDARWPVHREVAIPQWDCLHDRLFVCRRTARALEAERGRDEREDTP